MTACDYYVTTNRSETQLYRSCGPSLVNLSFPVSCNTSEYGVNRLCNCTTGTVRPAENDTCTETCDCLSAVYSYSETTQSPVAAPTTVPTTSPTGAPTIGLGNGSGVITCADSFSSNPEVCTDPTVIDYRGPNLR